MSLQKKKFSMKVIRITCISDVFMEDVRCVSSVSISNSFLLVSLLVLSAMLLFQWHCQLSICLFATSFSHCTASTIFKCCSEIHWRLQPAFPPNLFQIHQLIQLVQWVSNTLQERFSPEYHTSCKIQYKNSGSVVCNGFSWPRVT